MKLNEKIIYCRKKAGLSQLDLADQLGVSRQSVSKWETGEANPDVTKIPLLAKEFGVSADWLLSEDEPAEPHAAAAVQNDSPSYPDWVGQLPSHLGKMVKKFGWLYGVRMAVSGAVITGIGCLARAAFRSMLSPVSSFMDMGGMSDGLYIDGVPSGIRLDSAGFSGFDSFSSAAGETASLFTGFIIALGLIVTLSGIALAVALRKWGEMK